MLQLPAILALSLVTFIGASWSMGATKRLESAASPLSVQLQSLVEQAQLPGAIAIVERDGVQLHTALVGWQDVEASIPLREDSIFRLYSMSKPVTSVAIMMLVDQGKLSLHEAAATYLPEFEDMHVYVSGEVEDMVTEPTRRPITIRDLLLHNSGIAYHFTGSTMVHRYYRKYGVMRDTPVGRSPEDGEPARSLDELVRRIGVAPLLHQPGSGFHYSYSTTVLGAVIERVTGERLSTALRTMLFDPLGMCDTGFVIGDDHLARLTTLYEASPMGIKPIESPEESDYRDNARLLDGGGGIASTAGDYLRFLRMLANGGQLAGRRYLSETSVRDMFTDHIRIPGRGPTSTAFGYGFSIGDQSAEERGRQPAGTVGWSGSGNTFFFINPESGLISLFMTHELTPGEYAARGAEFRQIMTRVSRGADQKVRD
ncbi:MAG: CubicO group peptidase (beta-lactamase class C family) [Oceanicoccus sp.]|jgi:CubicO group peptidase (beta-lactamase class C family)